MDEVFFFKLILLIEDNLDVEKIDIVFMIDCMNMSYFVFYCKVKVLIEFSFNEFVWKIKLRNSVYLLFIGEYNVLEVVLMIGFNNMVYFCDCFKKEYGIFLFEY